LPPWDAQARQGTAAINDALSDLRHNAGDRQTAQRTAASKGIVCNRLEPLKAT